MLRTEWLYFQQLLSGNGNGNGNIVELAARAPAARRCLASAFTLAHGLVCRGIVESHITISQR
jgi:hypothetical protein